MFSTKRIFGVAVVLLLLVGCAVAPKQAAEAPKAIQFCNLVLRDGKFYIWPARPDGRCFAQDAKAEHLQR